VKINPISKVDIHLVAMKWRDNRFLTWWPLGKKIIEDES
jgi:hypothetical protein